MSPEAQRIAIAEACGWVVANEDEIRSRDPAGWLLSPGPWWRNAGEKTIAQLEGLPDYLSDLNAMHEAEKCYFATKPEPTWAYSTQLEEVVRRDWDNGMPDLNFVCFYCATATQRAEAFLRTLNLWTAP